MGRSKASDTLMMLLTPSQCWKGRERQAEFNSRAQKERGGEQGGALAYLWFCVTARNRSTPIQHTGHDRASVCQWQGMTFALSNVWPLTRHQLNAGDAQKPNGRSVPTRYSLAPCTSVWEINGRYRRCNPEMANGCRLTRARIDIAATPISGFPVKSLARLVNEGNSYLTLMGPQHR
jgi:hypothetical protein